jgi:glycosyltransferase involved in cell wall biosynthesis
MKASVCMSVYNKNDFLPNVLFSLSQQKTTFPFEVCIVDDHSDIDPYPLIEEFLVRKNIPVKYERFDKYKGFMYAYDLVLKMSSDDCDRMVLQSADVMYLEDNIIEELCKNLIPKKFTMLEVYNLPISKTFYLNFEKNKNEILQSWDRYEKLKHQLLYYEGLKRSTVWFFFLGSILKKDLRENYAVCDMLFNRNLHSNRMRPKFLNLHAVHQNHEHQQYVCPLIKTCGICSRTKLRKRRTKNG